MAGKGDFKRLPGPYKGARRGYKRIILKFSWKGFKLFEALLENICEVQEFAIELSECLSYSTHGNTITKTQFLEPVASSNQ